MAMRLPRIPLNTWTNRDDIFFHNILFVILFLSSFFVLNNHAFLRLL